VYIVNAQLLKNNGNNGLNIGVETIVGILSEGDMGAYVVGGKDYEVKVINISDDRLVMFSINGEMTDELADGETDVLADGTQIGVRDILVTGKDIQKSIVQFYLVDYFSNESLEQLMEMYNSNVEKAPAVAKFFKNERVNLYIEKIKKASISFVTKDGKMITVTKGELENPTVNVYTDMETIENIIRREMTFTEAMETGKITYKGVGFFKSIKIAIAKLGLRIYSFFAH